MCVRRWLVKMGLRRTYFMFLRFARKQARGTLARMEGQPAGGGSLKRGREQDPAQRGPRGQRTNKKSKAAPKGTDTFSDPNHQPSRRGWTLERKNDIFSNYYKSMNFFPEEEFDDFIRVLRTDLPSTFRITSTSSYAKLLRERIIQFSEEIAQLTDLDEQVTAAPIPWYPGNNAWYFSFSRHALRKAAVLKKYHQFIVAHSEAVYSIKLAFSR